MTAARSLGPAEGVLLKNSLPSSDHIMNADQPATPVQLLVDLAVNLTGNYMLRQIQLECLTAEFKGTDLFNMTVLKI